MESSAYYTTSTTSNAGVNAFATAFFMAILLAYLAALVVVIIGLWKVFAKAGQAGWKSLIPIYNYIIWCDIVGRPRWWTVLLFLPLVNTVIAVILALDLAKSFGKTDGYGVLIFLFGFVMFPVMGFSKDVSYVGPSAAPQHAGTPTPSAGSGGQPLPPQA